MLPESWVTPKKQVNSCFLYNRDYWLTLLAQHDKKALANPSWLFLQHRHMAQVSKEFRHSQELPNGGWEPGLQFAPHEDCETTTHND